MYFLRIFPIVFRAKRSREKRYAFDYVFDDKCEQRFVYERTTKPLINIVMSGYNATVFAYGATGAGKTHTMTGPKDNPVLFCRAKYKFLIIRATNKEQSN